jgi:activator of HSP90 ATPase
VAKIKMKDYKKYFHIPAIPEEVYATLTNPISLQLMTGERAEMSTEPGSEFSLWDGSIVGKNIEFEENTKIVQHWYFGDESSESIITIKLHPDKSGTSLELKHTNIPDEDYDDIVEGWNQSYMAALYEFFDE